MTTNSKSTRYYSSKQEKSLGKELGLKQTSNSGATRFSKGDIQDVNILMEAKTVMKQQKSFAIQKEWLDKNLLEAQSMGKQFALLAFNFGPGTEDYIVIRPDDFNNLYEAWKQVTK